MQVQDLSPSVEATKLALKMREAERREEAWGLMLRKGTDPRLKGLFDQMFSSAYWMGAVDLLLHEVRDH